VPVAPPSPSDDGHTVAHKVLPELVPELVPKLVMDIVYKPIDTPLVTTARARGFRVIHGGRMLLHQATAQFELYTGRAAPLAAMLAALRLSVGEEAPAVR
jgi:shikimate dehydrogenase